MRALRALPTPMAFAGAGVLARAGVRRDRIRLGGWVVLTAGLVAATASSVTSLYADPADRRDYAATAGTNSAIGGPGAGTDTLGGITVHEIGTITLILAAVAAILLTVRHTRAEEQTGRAELVGAAATSRHARLAAALAVVGGTQLAIGALSAVSLIGFGLPAGGSLAFGLAVAGTGWVFAGVAAVTAQIFEHARTAAGVALAGFGVAFVLRAVGDVNGGTAVGRLSLLSPIGWAQRVRAYAGERWWVIGLLVVTGAVLAGVAVALSARRDVGAGVIQARPGRARATPRLSGPWALAWRLQRGGLIGWTAGVALVAAVLGASAHDIGTTAGNNENAADVITRLGGAGDLTDSFLSWVLRVAGMAAALFAVAAVLRVRSEETGLRAEPVLAAAVRRVRWAAGHLVVAATGTVSIIAVSGLVVGLVHGLRTDDLADQLPRMLAGSLAQIPAALAVAAVAVALVGLLPRLALGAWAFAAAAVLLGQVGAALGLDQWALDVSPFTHVPRLPGGALTTTPLVWLTAVAAALTAAGLAGLRRRDITG
ncbi:ABC transporter permease [Actinomadura sp. HBU206391]|uniref:ABC transporter permease n=1 Tax=Actinomadura sp. HBU206391 TaxID=2731692 RepID=UPI00164FD9DC|nr:ABC transporter permease [Actinomadura sp. HBU206391]MBC6461174.1 ABC transporter permease [Actinomadura sp. HBU206391]